MRENAVIKITFLKPALDEPTLDSPFFYAVADLESGLLLFMGILDNPL